MNYFRLALEFNDRRKLTQVHDLQRQPDGL